MHEYSKKYMVLNLKSLRNPGIIHFDTSIRDFPNQYMNLSLDIKNCLTDIFYKFNFIGFSVLNILNKYLMTCFTKNLQPFSPKYILSMQKY